MRTWQGYHSEGARLYRDALKLLPGDKDAMEGLAFALHWGGDDKGAEEVVRELLRLDPGRTAAAGLYSEITAAVGYAGVYASHSRDKNRLAITARGARAGLRFNRIISSGLTIETDAFRQRGRAFIDAERYGASVSLRLSAALSLDSYLFRTAYGPGNYSPLTTNSWLSWRAADRWRIYAGYDRETFDDMNAITNSIITNGLSISADHIPDRFWLFGASYKNVGYSDTNRQDIIRLKAERQVARSPYLKAYYNFYFSGWKKILSSGYFNPRSVYSNWLGIFSAGDFGRLHAEGRVAAGYETQAPASNHPVYYASARLEYRLLPELKAEAAADWFSASTDARSNGYNRTSLRAGLNWRFGEAASKTRSASSTSRAAAK